MGAFLVMEFFDIVTDQGLPTANQVARDEAHRQGIWHKSAHVWVINPKGEVLFQLRSCSKQTFPGFWDVSAAGHLCAGDTSVEGAARELYEELGLKVEPEQLNFLATEKVRYTNIAINVDDCEFTDIYYVNLDVGVAQCVLQTEEVSAVRFVKYPELCRICKECPPHFVQHEKEYEMIRGILIQISGRIRPEAGRPSFWALTS